LEQKERKSRGQPSNADSVKKYNDTALCCWIEMVKGIADDGGWNYDEMARACWASGRR